MYKIGGSDADTFIMKFTLGVTFLGIVLLFGGKIFILLGDALMMKLEVITDLLTSPEGMKQIGSWLWEAIKSGKGA